MDKVLELLIELQNIDAELLDIEDSKGNLPEKVNTLQKDLEAKKIVLAEVEANLAVEKKDLAQLAGEIIDNESKLKKYQDQLYLVTTNKEYDALTNEIENIKAREEEIESIQESKEERAELYEKQVDVLKEEITELEKTLEIKTIELADKTDQNESRQEILEKNKIEIEAKISPRYLRKYQRIFKAKRNAIVKLYRHSCGGCHKKINDQKVYEIRQMNQLVECEGCGRILIKDDVEEID
jgi:predicted  nucleic acid-binding Zn-ribbon protein